MEPQIQYERASGDVSIAYAGVGSGPLLLVLRSIVSPDMAAELGEEPQWRAAWRGFAASGTVDRGEQEMRGVGEPVRVYAVRAGAEG